MKNMATEIYENLSKLCAIRIKIIKAFDRGSSTKRI